MNWAGVSRGCSTLAGYKRGGTRNLVERGDRGQACYPTESIRYHNSPAKFLSKSVGVRRRDDRDASEESFMKKITLAAAQLALDYGLCVLL